VPDPFALLQRLRVLEQNVRRLQQNAESIAQRRRSVAEAASLKLLENQEMLNSVRKIYCAMHLSEAFFLLSLRANAVLLKL
jgi:hypothetical protein